MPNMIRYAIFVVWIVLVHDVRACMPVSPDDVFIGRVQAVKHIDSNLKNVVHEFKLNHHKFIFRPIFSGWKYSQATHWSASFKLQDLHQDDLIIGLAYAPDGMQPNKYQLLSYATLKCQNNQLIIGKPLVPFLAWDRKNAKCQHTSVSSKAILDGFMNKDQTYYLNTLRKKYPTCRRLNSAFPTVN